MAQSFADFYEVDPALFAATGALDPILGVDTRLFIDPSFLRLTTTHELQDSYASLLTYFERVLSVIINIKKQGDRFWREADKLLTFPEVKGLCIGYAAKSTSGSGMGPAIRAKLLDSVTQIVSAGIKDPVLFEIVGTFEDDVGSDRISDMIAKIIIADLVKYTQRVCSDCGIPMETLSIGKNQPMEDLPINPFTNGPIILMPREVLNDLPTAEDFSDIQRITRHNEKVRGELNVIIGSSWSKATQASRKEAARITFVSHPEVLAEILETYKKSTPPFYDFDDDRSGEVIWYPVAREIAKKIQLPLTLSRQPSSDEVESVVLTICEHFRQLIENNQLCELLYDKNNEPKHESAAQLLFFGIADAYCKSNNLDLSPESDSGRGPVDFKVSSGYDGRVLVELKLTSNNQLLHGFTKQLPTYQAAENTERGILLVIDNGGASESRLKKFNEAVNNAGKKAPKVIMVDGISRPSASVTKDK
jgi:hypothetical protein